MKRILNFCVLALFVSILSLSTGCKEGIKKTDEASLAGRGEKTDHLDRFELEIQKFEELDKEKMPENGGILFTGSSSIRLWSGLAKDFKGLPAFNRGFGGSTIPEVMYYADRVIFKYQPKVIVFYCGENDIADEAEPTIVFQNFKKLVGQIEAKLPNTLIIYVSAKPSPSRWALWNKVSKLNDMVEKFAENRPSVQYADISPALLGPDGKPDPSLFVEDQLHMNEKGYAKWAAILKPIVEEAFSKN